MPSEQTPQPTPPGKPSAHSTGKPNLDPETMAFIQAIDEYKRDQGRPFPSWSEVLQIVKALGYEKTGTQRKAG